MAAGFKITRGKGFEVEFANGWRASVQFGTGNYCERQWDSARDRIDPHFDERASEVWESRNAEIAALPERNGRDTKEWHSSWYDFGDDRVEGWVKPDEIPAFLDMVSKFEDAEVLFQEGRTINEGEVPTWRTSQ